MAKTILNFHFDYLNPSLRSLEADSDSLIMRGRLQWYMWGWMGLGWDQMAIIAHRYSKSTFGANKYPCHVNLGSILFGPKIFQQNCRRIDQLTVDSFGFLRHLCGVKHTQANSANVLEHCHISIREKHCF